MSDTTTNLLLPFIMAAQAQKHVTHNEALRLLDGIVQLAVQDKDLAAPPALPAEDGARYIVAPGATGLWAGWDSDVALWVDGAWMRLPAQPGWQAWVVDEQALYVRTTAGWMSLLRGDFVTLAQSPYGDSTSVGVLEETVSGLAGSARETTIRIPDRAIVFGVSCRVVTAITGAASYDCGIAGEPDKFGAALGIAAGSSNAGVIGPQAFYADTPIVLTANGGAFTGGAVRISVHYMTLGTPN
ncbi:MULTISPECIES: DUF2793 domain-containing protein [unclassified Yoonia]|uniref:DUF2793 domain-containing protein n=1 Tax=unclassified Yoonia TaxID=2629118 RepID=UPI002AFDCABF|nr:MULTISPECIES: DUF2793 domain-containing protein [unclassified Yoonia]